MTFPGLEMTILKFHDFSRFSMTARTLTFVKTQRIALWDLLTKSSADV